MYMVQVMFYLAVWKTKVCKSLGCDNKEDPGLLHPILCRHLLGPQTFKAFPINISSESHSLQQTTESMQDRAAGAPVWVARCTGKPAAKHPALWLSDGW